MGGFHLFTLADVPVWVSPWYLMLLLFFMVQGNIAHSMLLILCVTLSLLAHEFGHALVAKRYRLQPQILLHGFGGLTGHQRARTNGQDALIIAAGPSAGLLLGTVSLVALIALVPAQHRNLESVLMMVGGHAEMPATLSVLANLVRFNYFWSVFNALPLWPMDGGQLFRLGMLKLLKPGRAERVTHLVGVVTTVLVAVAFYQWLSMGPMMLMILGLMGWQNVQALRAGGSGEPVRRDNAFARELIQKADRAYQQGDDEEATRLCHQVRAESNVAQQVLARAWAILGVTTTRKGEYEEALSYLRRAPDSTDVVEATAQCFYQLEMYEALAALIETKAFARLPRETRDDIVRALHDTGCLPHRVGSTS